MFCPKCREHWQILTSTATKKEPAPFTCPSCGVPLATDRIAAEFPAFDMSGRVGSQSLTVGQFMRETSENVVHVPSDDEEVRVLVARSRRGGWWSDARGRASQITRQEGFIGYASIMITIVVLAIVCSLNLPTTGDTSAPAARPTVASVLPATIMPASIAGWSRWPQVTEFKDAGDGHQLATSTYERGAARAEVWVQWLAPGTDAYKSSWAHFTASAPLVQGPALGATLQARDQMIGNKTCRIWEIPQKRLATTRIVPTSWLPSSEPVTVSWQNDSYVVTVAGTESNAMTVARILASGKTS